MADGNTQDTQVQTQNADIHSFYEASLSNVFAKFVSLINQDITESVTLIKKPEAGYIYKFGRHPSCDVQFQGSRISNIHFAVWEEMQSSQYAKRDDVSTVIMIKDLSTNGTYLNQARIGKGQSTVLVNGDEVAVGVGIERDEIRYLVQLPQSSRQVVQMDADQNYIRSKYDVREVLGSGAFATVRRAIEKSTGRAFAIKIMNQRKMSVTHVNSKAAELFKREIEILQSTRHPNIVQYIDMWADTSDIYLVIEYLPAGDLMDYIIKNKLLSESRTKKIITQLLDALCYCHRLGIAHRDIKPENILLTSDDPPVAKLTDFGLAKMVGNGESFLKTFCGTLTYVAPEVISLNGRVAGGYSNAVDMWSLGCVTFICVAGSMPFVAEEQEMMMRIIKEGEYDQDALDDVELSGSGVDFIEHCLTVDPARRMTGEEALEHPWITQDLEDEERLPVHPHSQTAASRVFDSHNGFDDYGSISTFGFDRSLNQQSIFSNSSSQHEIVGSSQAALDSSVATITPQRARMR